MRTNIEIDDELLSAVMQATGLSTKRATIEEALRVLLRLRRQKAAVEGMRGLGWDGDLDAMRRDIDPDDGS